MFLHRVQSTYGRVIPKPQKDEKAEEILDEAIPIQDQIEALRTKIQLKERYNRVLKDELEESRLGASSILSDLYNETADLRVQLVEALNAEKAAVQNALRTHREFQLAMTDKVPEVAIGWLDDKLFDLSKLLNFYLHRLIERQKALEEAEQMVVQIEKWPRPGTLPWEIDAIENFQRLESMIEKVKVMYETTSILNLNYHKVKHILREEKGKYAPIIRGLDDQVLALRNEKSVLQKMLDDAIYFADEAQKTLAITEKEASENRKKRRRQMGKMKKAVEKVLKANQIRPPHHTQRKNFIELRHDENAAKANFLEAIRLKRQEVEAFQARAKRLVDTMRVPDLTFIPPRFRHVMALGEKLEVEQTAKEELRDLLLKHKDQLFLIMCHFGYTGMRRQNEFDKREKEFNEAIKDVAESEAEIRKHANDYGDRIVTLRMGAIALLDRLDEGRRRHVIKPEFPETLRAAAARVRRLVREHKHLEDMFKGPAAKNYGAYVKAPTVHARLIRVGTPEQSEDSDEDDLVEDAKVPNRKNIKDNSARVTQQGMLQRGCFHIQNHSKKGRSNNNNYDHVSKLSEDEE